VILFVHYLQVPVAGASQPTPVHNVPTNIPHVLRASHIPHLRTESEQLPPILGPLMTTMPLSVGNSQSIVTEWK